MTFSKNKKYRFSVVAKVMLIPIFKVVARKLRSRVEFWLKNSHFDWCLGKNDFFQKQKNPNLGFGQSDVDSDFQGCRPKNEVRRPFINFEIAIFFLGSRAQKWFFSKIPGTKKFSIPK